MVCLRQHQDGIEAARKRDPVICKDLRAAFMDILIAEGFRGVCNIKPEKFQRYDTADCKRGRIPAWSMYREIEIDGGVIGHGTYGNFQTGFTQNWSSVSEHKMKTSERAQYYAQREAMKSQREVEEKQRHSNAAKKAFEIWSTAPDATEHEYLRNKNVKTAIGLKVANDKRLIIPIAVNNDIVSLQFISPDGTKRFLSGGGGGSRAAGL
jgi:putative DNA primase/helicase